MIESWLWRIVLVAIVLVIKRLILFLWADKVLNRWLEEKKKQYGEIINSEPDYNWEHILLSVFFGPVIEEIIFRGPILIFMPALSVLSWAWLVVMVIISGIIFGLMHYSNEIKFKSKTVNYPTIAVLNSTIGGVFYGLLLVFTGSLLVPIIAHSAWNISCNFGAKS